MSDFSSDEFLKDKPYWDFFPSKSNLYKTSPLSYRTRGILFANVVNDGVIRINDANKVLILEHITFNSITSNQNGGCVLFNTGHSFYQKDICARNVHSSTKGKYGYINILKTSENINYHSMISITDCTTTPAVLDLFWIGGGKTSISNYNSTNNYVLQTPGFYSENSFGKANATFINILSGTAVQNFIVCSNSDCSLKYSNFVQDKIVETVTTRWLLGLLKESSSVDHCVFVENTAPTFLAKNVPLISYSFYKNSINTAPPSVQYFGSHSFVVNTQCYMLNHKNCVKNNSCVSRYFTLNSLIFTFSIFILFI